MAKVTKKEQAGGLPAVFVKEIQSSQIEDQSLTQKIASKLVPYLDEINEKVDQLKKLKKGDPEDAKVAKRISLDIGKILARSAEEKKKQKEFYLLVGRYIDSLNRVIESMGRLTQKEADEHSEYFENLERIRIEKLVGERQEELAQYEFNYKYIDLGNVPEDQYQEIVQQAKDLFEKKKKEAEEAELKRLEEEKIRKEEEARKAEEERLEKIRLEEENKKLKEQEEIRLKAEAEENKKREELANQYGEALVKLGFTVSKNKGEIQYENEGHLITRRELFYLSTAEFKAKYKVIKQDLIKARELEQERQENERIRKELEAKREQDRLKEQERLKTEQQKEQERIEAEKAPVKDKLRKWLDGIAVEQPKLESVGQELIVTEIIEKFEGFKKWAYNQIEKL